MAPGPRGTDHDRFYSRREWLATLGVGGLGGVAGCAGLGGDGDDGPPETGDDGGTDQTGDGGTPGGDGGDGLPTVSGTYDTVTGAAFSTLNPLYNTESGAGDAIGRALDQGYTFDTDQELFPLVYDMSTDQGGVWVFEIRDGLEFSEPYGQVDAESFVYQIEMLHQSDWANTASSGEWEGVTVERTGTLEFQAELEEPRLLWPESFDPLEYPIPKGLIEPYVEDEDVEGLQQDEELLELQFTGNLGGFVLDEWNRGAGTTYSRNDEYYIQDVDAGPDRFAGAPYFEGSSISVIEEQASRLGALETGEADAASIPPERFAEFDDKPTVEVRQIPQPFNRIMAVNMRENGWTAGPGNLFRLTEFRQGLACAISKQELIDGVYRGLAAPHFTWQPAWSRWYPEADDDIRTFGVGDLYGESVARRFVRDALERTDHDYGFDGGALLTPAGEQVTLDLYHSAGAETSKLMAEFVAEELDENLGIDVVVEAIDGVRFNDDYWTADPEGGTATVGGEELEWTAANPRNPGPRSVTSNQPWDMSVVFGLNTYPLNPLTNEAFFDGATTFYNPVGYYPEFEAGRIFQEARQATSEAALQDAFEELFVKLAAEQPYIMLVFTDSLTGYNPDLRGPIEDFANGWDFPAWYFES